ncbi:Golgin candidate 5 [Nymphaea thermarum]|nr:Golgin candidate 5 [Nymphaea thermarum]
MAWLGKVSLGGFPDLAGAVTKLSESVKNIEKNFDSALGLEEKPDAAEESGSSWVSSETKTIFNPVMAFMGQRTENNEPVVNVEPPQKPSLLKEQVEPSSEHVSQQTASSQETGDEKHGIVGAPDIQTVEDKSAGDKPSEDQSTSDLSKEDHEHKSQILPIEQDLSPTKQEEAPVAVQSFEPKDSAKVSPGDGPASGDLGKADKEFPESATISEEVPPAPEPLYSGGVQESNSAEMTNCLCEKVSVPLGEALDTQERSVACDSTDVPSTILVSNENPTELLTNLSDTITSRQERHALEDVADDSGPVVATVCRENESDNRKQTLSPEINTSDSVDCGFEAEKLRAEMKMMEAALQGAARQAQAKADEIAKFMNENEQLKSAIEDLKRRTSDEEVDALREEYHQRVATLEKKVYALTRERDALRREQSRKSDAAALLKEKDEIISQVMAEGEELSKKQATQEATIRKLRAQVREFEEEKQRLASRIQVEEAKVESIKKDKSATERLLQETVERSQTELAAQKEFYTNALNAAKEAEALAESRANSEAKAELERRLREAGEREATLLQTIEELRQTLSRTEQQAVFREDILRRDIDDLKKYYQESERRCEELKMQVPESTRPLLRQIEAMKEATGRQAEAWSGVEKSLRDRLLEAEIKAATAEERERSMSERLSQTVSRMAVLEAQVSCLRTEQTQLTRSLEKERQRASENRQEYLALQEAAATHEGRAKQLEDEIKELRSKHKRQMLEEAEHRGLLEQELERERAAKLELERFSHLKISVPAEQTPIPKHLSAPYYDNGMDTSLRKHSSAGSLRNMEESFYLQASLDSFDSATPEIKTLAEAAMSPYSGKSMTPSAMEHIESTLRQKDGELSSYMSRLVSLESIRDSLAEELVKMTSQCEKLRTEVAVLPSLKAELEALRRRHSAALELMGERDEELEELRADIYDLKEMYREQVDLLVNKQ